MNTKEINRTAALELERRQSTAERVPLRSLLSDTAIYGLANVSDKLIAVLLLPLMTAVLSRADYGLISLYTSTSYILFVFFSAGVHHAYYRYYTETCDVGERRAITRRAILLAIRYAAILVPLLLIFGPWFSGQLFDNSGYGYVAALCAVGLMQTLQSIGIGRMQADGRPWTYFWLMMTSSLALRGAGIWLVLIGCGAWGWVVGEGFGRLITVLILGIVVFNDLTRTQDGKPQPGMGTYGMWLVPAMLSFFVMGVSDKYLLRLLLPDGFEQIGLYSVGERIAGFMQLSSAAFLIGWQRFAFRNMHLPSGSRILGQGLLLFAVAGGYCAMALALLGDDVTHWLIHPKFAAGMVVIPPLTLGALFSGLAIAAEVGLHKSRKPALISSANLAAALLNVVMAYFAILRWGIVGAAWSTAICQAYRLAIVWRTAQKCFPVQFDYRRLALASALFFGIFALGQTVRPWGWTTSTIVQTLLVLITPVLLWFTPFVSANQRQELLDQFLRLRNPWRLLLGEKTQN